MALFSVASNKNTTVIGGEEWKRSTKGERSAVFGKAERPEMSTGRNVDRSKPNEAETNGVHATLVSSLTVTLRAFGSIKKWREALKCWERGQTGQGSLNKEAKVHNDTDQT